MTDVLLSLADGPVWVQWSILGMLALAAMSLGAGLAILTAAVDVRLPSWRLSRSDRRVMKRWP
jgi:hypothetical protein